MTCTLGYDESGRGRPGGTAAAGKRRGDRAMTAAGGWLGWRCGLGGHAVSWATVVPVVRLRTATSRLLLHELGLALAEPAGRPVDPKLAGLVGQLRVRRGAAASAKIRVPRPTGKAFRGE